MTYFNRPGKKNPQEYPKGGKKKEEIIVADSPQTSSRLKAYARRREQQRRLTKVEKGIKGKEGSPDSSQT